MNQLKEFFKHRWLMLLAIAIAWAFLMGYYLYLRVTFL